MPFGVPVVPAPVEWGEESSQQSSPQGLSLSSIDASPNHKSITAWQSNNTPFGQAATQVTRACELIPPQQQFTHVVLDSVLSMERETCSGLDTDEQTDESWTEGLSHPSQDQAPALPAQRYAVGPDGKVFFNLGDLSVRTLRQLGTIMASLIVPPVLATTYSMSWVHKPQSNTTSFMFHMIDHAVFGIAIMGFFLGIQSICFHHLHLYPAGILYVVWIIVSSIFEVVAFVTDMPLRDEVAHMGSPAVIVLLSMTTFVISWRHAKKHDGVLPSRILPSGKPAPQSAQKERCFSVQCLPCRLERLLQSISLMFTIGPLSYMSEWILLVLMFHFKGQPLQVIPLVGRGLVTLVSERLYHKTAIWAPVSYYWQYAYYLAARFIFGTVTTVVIQDYRIFLLSEALVLASLSWLLFKLWLSIGTSAPGWLKDLLGARMDLSPEHLVSIMSLNVFFQLVSAIFICLQHLVLPNLPLETLIFFYASLLRAVVAMLAMHWIARHATGFSPIQGYCDAVLREPVYLTTLVLFIEIQALLLLLSAEWAQKLWSAQGIGDAR